MLMLEINSRLNDYELGQLKGGLSVWMIVAIVLAIVGAILTVVLFLPKKNAKNIDNKHLKWFYDFLNFDKLWIEDLIKVLYIFFTIYFVLMAFGFIAVSFASFLGTLIFGIFGTRILAEWSLMLVKINKNTTDIKKSVEDIKKK